MRVVTLVGSRAGEVINLPVPVAQAMLADGRAVPVPAEHDESPSVASVVPSADAPTPRRRRS